LRYRNFTLNWLTYCPLRSAATPPAMARQRMLERCKPGWKFLRIRGSVFYANRIKAMRELVAAIVAHGIRPHILTDDENVIRSWVKEVSGNQCMEELGAHTVDAARERIVQPDSLSAEDGVDVEASAIESSPAPEYNMDGEADGRLNNMAVPDVAMASPSVSDTTRRVEKIAADDAASAEVIAIESNVWFEIAHWAKQNDQLAGWQRGLAYSLGVRKRQGVAPTPKQEKQGKRILETVRERGFTPSVSSQLTLPMLDEIRAS
jgi:hypothetical protein